MVEGLLVLIWILQSSYSAIGSFHESDIGIFHRLQAGEIIIRTLQGRGAVGTSLLQGSGIQEHLMAQVDAVAVVAEIVDLPNLVSGVIGFRRITVSLVLHQMQGNGDVFPARDGIGRKLDEILVEAEVSIINAGDWKCACAHYPAPLP